ncbi:MAG TPA: large conductance mechanosensitive channel protein MscL [Bacillota bacterium]|nr:large conductance mechanosensitive channel protein MscL [Bacillota bacterium]HOH10513.1 large conductance mechanosensitive channel protein MscL [Bacillota bacterium]HOS49881.1 large conductance mechanosensitive channel protein MscL [Bacillota bacterium]HQJ24619.1 large conductance mechanosensitive channel protein MscL [Bacillota bacterium]
MLQDFKKFVMRGNVIDLAVGIIIGGAFGKIVSSFVNEILMPPIGMLLGKVDFKNLFVSLDGNKYVTLADAQAAGAATINYGSFIGTVIDFVIIAFVIFIMIRTLNRAKERLEKKQEAPAATPTTKQCPHCFTDINIKATRCPNCTSELK